MHSEICVFAIRWRSKLGKGCLGNAGLMRPMINKLFNVRKHSKSDGTAIKCHGKHHTIEGKFHTKHDRGSKAGDVCSWNSIHVSWALKDKATLWRDVWPPYSLVRWNRAGGIVLFLDARRILRQASENCAIRITSRINSYRSSDASLPHPVSKLSWTNGNQSSWLKLFSSFRIHRKSQSNSSKNLWWIDSKGSAIFLSSTSTRRFRSDCCICSCWAAQILTINSYVPFMD